MSRNPKPTRAELFNQLTAAAGPLDDKTLAALVEHAATAEDRADAARMLTDARNGDANARKMILKTVSSTGGYAHPICGFVRVTSDPVEYHVRLDDSTQTRLPIGGINVLDNQTLYRRAFLATVGWGPHPVKEWGVVVNQLIACATDETPDEATTDAGRGARWLRRYLKGDTAVTDITRPRRGADDEAKATWRTEALHVAGWESPFYDDKGLHVFLEPIRTHLRDTSHGAEKPTAAEVSKCLRAAGCKPDRTKFPRVDPKAELTTLSTWIVPTDLDPTPKTKNAAGYPFMTKS